MFSFAENTRPTTSSYKSQVSKEIEESNYQDNEMKKALQLKEHYFGARVIKKCAVL